MKRLWNKLQYAILLIVVIFISFGCSLDNRDKKESDTRLETNDGKEVTIKFYTYNGHQNENTQNVLAEVNKKLTRNINTKLELQIISPSTYIDDIKRLLSSGDAVDGIQSPNLQFIKDMYTKGLLLDITQLFPEHAPKYMEKFTEAELRQVSCEGKIMAVPNHWPSTSRLSAVVNKELAEKYHFSDIKDLEDYEMFLKTIKENENSIVPATGYFRTDTFLMAYGYMNLPGASLYLVYDYMEPKTKITPWEQTNGFRMTYEMLKRWYKNGYVDNSVVLPKEGSENPVRTSGKSASTIMAYSGAYTAAHSVSTNIDLVVYPLYLDKSSEKVPITDSIVFNKNSINPGKALDFIEWLHSEQENYDLFMYGKEGENYTLKDGKLVLPEDGSSYYGWFGSKAYQDIDLNRPLEYEPEEANKMMTDMLKKSIDSPISGFSIDLQSLGMTMATMLRDRSNSIKEIEDEIGTGIFNTDIDEFINKQKDMGINNLIEKVQKQIDKWSVSGK